MSALWLGWLPTGHAESSPCGPGLDQHIMTAWTSEDGLPLDAVYTIVQDADDYLWVGTEDGLARFDGVAFERMALSQILGDAPEYINSLVADAAGNVYASTTASGIIQFSRSAPHDPTMLHPMLQVVYQLLVGEDAILLAASRGQGLLQINLNDSVVSEPVAGRRSTSINAIAERSAGGYWIGHAGGGLQWFDGAAFHSVAGTESIADLHISALLEDSTGVLWIGSRTGLFSLNRQQLQSHGAEAGLEEPVYALSLLEDSNGRLWVGLGGGGVARRCGSRFETLTPDQGLSQGRINAIFEDHEGSIWLASGGGGLVQLRVGQALPIASRHGLPPSPVLPIIQTPDRTMWMGTFGGGLARLDDTGVTIISSAQGLINDRVLALATDEEGGLWVGTHGGLSRILDGAVERSWTVQDGLPHDTVISLLRDDRRLWIGTVDGLAMMEDESLHSYAPEGGFNGYIIYMLKRRDGSLWLGTDGGGAFQMRDERIEPVPFADRLPATTVTGLHETDTGILWVTTSAGLLRWDGERASRVGLRHGLPNSHVFSIIEDGLGGTWMSSNRGVFRVDHDALEAVATGNRERLDVVQFTRADGMPRSETNGGFQPAVWRDHLGRLWYPTTDGAAIFNPQALELEKPAPRPAIRRITTADDQLDIRGEIRLDPLPQWLEFSYSAPTFIQADQVEYQYRLAGFDSDWYATADQSAMYRRLPAGQYEFELRARKPRSDWSQIAGVELTVARYWLHQPWLWVAAALLVLSGWAVINHRLQNRREMRRERAMQAQKLEAIGLMAGGIAHDFNNVLTSIMGGTEMLADKFPPDSHERQHAQRILESAESGAGLTRQLMAFAKRQPVEPKWLDLSREINLFRDFLSRLLTRKIRLEWQIDTMVGFCHADRVQLQQVMINLVINARDAMPGGGELLVRLTPAESGRNDLARLMVADTGFGMDQATRQRIFEPFFTTKQPEQGTGLGLSVTYGIVRQVGGWIEVESWPGKGTRFHILLPVRPERPKG